MISSSRGMILPEDWITVYIVINNKLNGMSLPSFIDSHDQLTRIDVQYGTLNL